MSAKPFVPTATLASMIPSPSLSRTVAMSVISDKSPVPSVSTPDSYKSGIPSLSLSRSTSLPSPSPSISAVPSSEFRIPSLSKSISLTSATPSLSRSGSNASAMKLLSAIVTPVNVKVPEENVPPVTSVGDPVAKFPSPSVSINKEYTVSSLGLINREERSKAKSTS